MLPNSDGQQIHWSGNTRTTPNWTRAANVISSDYNQLRTEDGNESRQTESISSSTMGTVIADSDLASLTLLAESYGREHKRNKQGYDSAIFEKMKIRELDTHPPATSDAAAPECDLPTPFAVSSLSDNAPIFRMGSDMLQQQFDQDIIER